MSPRAFAAITIAVATASLVGLAVATPGWPALVAWTALGGISNGFGHPASNALLNEAVTPTRRAFAFGIKQSAVPASGLIAGVSLPLVALTLGWHAVFVAGAVAGALLLAAFLAVSGRRSARAAERTDRQPRISGPLLRVLLLLSCGTMLTGGSATALTAFFTTTGVQRGLDPALAGAVLALGTALSATTRLIMGAVAGRRDIRPLRTISVLALFGGVGALTMTLPGPAALVGGFLVATGIGWGWPGLVHFSITTLARDSTLAATGIVQTGTYLGSTVSPILVGLIVGSAAGPEPAWVLLGCMSLGGAAMFALAHVLRRRWGVGAAPPGP